jgi:hypothetical protein
MHPYPPQTPSCPLKRRNITAANALEQLQLRFVVRRLAQVSNAFHFCVVAMNRDRELPKRIVFMQIKRLNCY